jgi:hypothetical protein
LLGRHEPEARPGEAREEWQAQGSLIHRDRKEDTGGQGEGNGKLLFGATEFQLVKMLWKWMVVMVAPVNVLNIK